MEVCVREFGQGVSGYSLQDEFLLKLIDNYKVGTFPEGIWQRGTI
jgi:hypothetical protein